jgi:hypothetical protein
MALTRQTALRIPARRVNINHAGLLAENKPKRIGHADVAFTMRQYVQTDLEADREVANTLADLIIGGLLVSRIDEHDSGTA